MKVYLFDYDKDCPDYTFTKEIIQKELCQESSMDDADICLYNTGVYISKHNARILEADLAKPISKNKKIFIVKPFGTSYLPLYFRRLGLNSIELLYSQISAVLKDEEPDSSKILFNRYC